MDRMRAVNCARVSWCGCACGLQAFKQLDKDGSGTICIDELAEACRWVGMLGLGPCLAGAVLGPTRAMQLQVPANSWLCIGTHECTPSRSCWGTYQCFNQHPVWVLCIAQGIANCAQSCY